MNTYRIVFVNNAILSISLIKERAHHFEGDMYYTTYNEHLVYAIIKTDTESEARKKSEQLIHTYLATQQKVDHSRLVK